MGNNLLQGATLVCSKPAWVYAPETERCEILTKLHSMLRAQEQSEFGHRLRMFDFTNGMTLVFLHRKLGNQKRKKKKRPPQTFPGKLSIVCQPNDLCTFCLLICCFLLSAQFKESFHCCVQPGEVLPQPPLPQHGQAQGQGDHGRGS